MQAGLVAYLDTYPTGIDASSQQAIADFLISLTPQTSRQQIQLAIASLSTMVHLLSMIGPHGDELLQFIIANPLANTNAAVPTGFAPSIGRSYGGGFVGRSGAYIEGDNIVMPGGGGILNGQLFIP